MPQAQAEGHEVLWSPPEDVRSTTRIGDYLDWLERRTGRRFDDYESLWAWSVDDLDGFLAVGVGVLRPSC